MDRWEEPSMGALSADPSVAAGGCDPAAHSLSFIYREGCKHLPGETAVKNLEQSLELHRGQKYSKAEGQTGVRSKL